MFVATQLDVLSADQWEKTAGPPVSFFESTEEILDHRSRQSHFRVWACIISQIANIFTPTVKMFSTALTHMWRWVEKHIILPWNAAINVIQRLDIGSIVLPRAPNVHKKKNETPTPWKRSIKSSYTRGGKLPHWDANCVWLRLYFSRPRLSVHFSRRIGSIMI